MTKLSPTSARRTKRSTGVEGSTSVPGGGDCMTTEPSVPPGEKTPNERPSTRPAALRRTSTVWIDWSARSGTSIISRPRDSATSTALRRLVGVPPLGTWSTTLPAAISESKRSRSLTPVDGDARARQAGLRLVERKPDHVGQDHLAAPHEAVERKVGREHEARRQDPRPQQAPERAQEAARHS